MEDHCAGIEAILMNAVVGESYHLAANQSITNIELVKQICQILDDVRPKKDGKSYADQITLIPDRAGHDRKYALDSTKARLQLNWSARVPSARWIEQGCGLVFGSTGLAGSDQSTE